MMQPTYPPESNPVKRFVQELYRALEGRMYALLATKQEVLQTRQADPARVRRLCDRDWTREALTTPPADTPVTSSQPIGISERRGSTGLAAEDASRWLLLRVLLSDQGTFR